ncbi:MAG: 3-deoxy-manno-octulosonate cytidylyltransferase [Lewinella sp.]|nr:3-deoxy-manno-octulosonate cytidylyltransferase [Lewinella sp.]
MKIIGVIPARYASTRFPGKPLALLGGKPMVQWVYEQASRATSLDRVVVATDDHRIATAVTAFGGDYLLTSPDHPSGTDRVAEVARQHTYADVVVNIQGDEPFIDPGQIEAVVAPFSRPEVDITTLRRRIRDEADLFNSNVVKVVCDAQGKALLFSRESIPHLRGTPRAEWLARGEHFQHLGLYAYRASVLQDLTELALGRLEQLESLEQLRWLEAGYRIFVEETTTHSLGIDTPEDLARAEAFLLSK